MTDKALFLKSISEMTPEELDQRIDQAKRGEVTFKFARKREDMYIPTIYGKAPMVISDEIVGGRYSPADGQVYESRRQWMKSFEDNDIHMVDVNTKLPPKKIDQISDKEYEDTFYEAKRMLEWKEETVGEQEVERNKQIREAMLNKYGTDEQRKPKNRRKIIEGQ